MGSQGSINEFKKPGSPLEGIATALKIVHDVYGLDTQAAQQKLLGQQIDKGEQASQLAAAQSDPDSTQSQLAREETAAAIDYSRKKGIVSPEKASALMGLIKGTPGKPAIPAGSYPGFPGPVTENEIPAVPGTPAMSAAGLNANKEASPLMDFTKAQLAADASANRMAGLVGIKQQQFDETQNQNAGKVGEHFEADPIIKASKISKNSLERSLSILSNDKKPVTAKDLNLAYNDYINAVTAGGAATEGKINRELPETWAQSFNDLKAKAGEFDDMRHSPTGAELIRQLRENISTVKNDLTNATEEQAANIYQNYGQSTNPKVQEIAKAKFRTYAPNKFSQTFGGQSPAPKETQSPTPEAPAQWTPDKEKRLQELRAKVKK